DRFIGASPALRVVGQQEDARMGQLASRGPPLGDQVLQRRPLPRAEGNSILLHRCPLSPGALSLLLTLLGQGYRSTRQSKFEGRLAVSAELLLRVSTPGSGLAKKRKR